MILMTRDNSGNNLISFLTGGLIGLAIGILFAPRSGEETRDIIRKKGLEIKEKATTASEEIGEKGKELLEETKTLLTEVKKHLEEVINVVKDTISSQSAK
jgi:gas vesicle protein